MNGNFDENNLMTIVVPATCFAQPICIDYLSEHPLEYLPECLLEYLRV